MDNETFDRLLIDRAVGQLDDDAARLLAAYLADHSEFQERAESIEQTVEMAKLAFRRYEARELPPLDRYRVEASRKSARRSKLLRQALTVAAAFVLGASTALITRPAERLIPDGRDVTAPGSVFLATYPMAQPATDDDFWSFERIPLPDQVRNTVGREYPSRRLRDAIEATF